MAELRGNSVDWSSRITSLNTPFEYYRCGCAHPDPLYVVWVLRYTGRRVPSQVCLSHVVPHQERPHVDAATEAG